MPPRRRSKQSSDPGLNRERILDAAIAFADEHGVAAMSMRKLAATLGVEAMSIYYYLPNKDALLDGMVERVFASIQAPDPTAADWRAELHTRAHSTRAVLLQHPWSIALLDARSTPGMSTLQHHDAVIGCLLNAGFSVAMTAHAFALLDSFIYGFVMQEISLPFEPGDDVSEEASDMLTEEAARALPHLTRFTLEHIMQPGYDFSQEFDFGLAFILDGLAAQR